jgi:hypothetical protein
MLTEFEVRQRMDRIRESRMAPLRKARLLLRLGRSLKSQVKSLNHAQTQLSQTPERIATAGVVRLTVRTQLLHEDVREAALGALQPETGLKFNSG